MSDVSLSQEELPQGKNRCPKCKKIHDVEQSKIEFKDELLSPEQKVLQQYMEKEIGSQTDHLKCPHCGATYTLTHASGNESSSSESIKKKTVDEEISQQITEQIIAHLDKYTEIWIKVLVRKFTIVKKTINKIHLERLVVRISQFLFVCLKKDKRFNDDSALNLSNSILRKLRSRLKIGFDPNKDSSFFDKLSDDHKNALRALKWSL